MVVAGYGERAEFVEETFSTSPLAKKFGIKFYPAIFVNEVLIAKPNDFFGSGAGRYKPWRDPKNQEKFKNDLIRMVEMAMKDEKALAKAGVSATDATGGPAPLMEIPAFALVDLDGKTVDSKALRGRVTVVEFWAEWCPPCRSTLAWLNETQKKYGQSVQVLGIAVESEEAKIREMVKGLNLTYPNMMATAEVVQQFGDILSVPTLFVFDRQGRSTEVFYGAPPALHEQIARAIAAALK